MTWQDIQRKLTSRKFWAAVCSFVTLLIVALGYAEETATQVAGLIMAGATVIAYIVGEGMADAANISTSAMSTIAQTSDEIKMTVKSNG